MQNPANEDVEFILGHAERLVNVAMMCVISFGLADGLNEALKGDHPEETDDYDWRQAAAGFQDGTLMMSALRAALLLDRDETKVSFQTIHSRLKSKVVQTLLKQSLSELHGLDELFRDELIAGFLATYSEIDWKVHGRLTHFRNLGIAHLTIEKMTKSITFDELRKLVSIISRLTTTIQQLCHTPTAFQEWMLDDYREIARSAMKRNPPA